jgi:hypothetical protein
LITLTLATVAIVWLTDFVLKVLETVWPVAAAAVLVCIACAALALCIRMLGSALRTLRPEPAPFDVLTTATPSQTFASTVTDWMANAAADTAPNPTAQRERNDIAVVQFCMVGDWHGFAQRKMQPYISRTKWDVYIELLTSLKPRPILISDHEGTRWYRGTNLAGLRHALKLQLIALPYPAGDLPPVDFEKAALHAQQTQHTQANAVSAANTVISTSPSGVLTFSQMGGH